MRRLLLLLLLIGAWNPAGLKATSFQEQELSDQADSRAKLNFAAGQHEIIRVLLEEARFSEVLVEFRKILELDLRGPNEKPVVEEAWVITEQLREADQHELSHQLIDETLDHTQSPDSKFYLFILKGKTFHDQERTREAIEAFRRAQEFKE